MWMYYLFFAFFILSLCTPSKSTASEASVRNKKKPIIKDDDKIVDSQLQTEEIDYKEFLTMQHEINKLKQHIKNLNYDMCRTKGHVSKLYERSLNMSIIDY